MKISQELYDDIVAHAIEDAPAECYGLVASSNDTATKVLRAKNATEPKLRPLRFEIDGREVYELLENQIEGQGLELAAIYHSHTRTAPKPSQTDIAFAKNWPGVLWIIVGLAGGEPEVRTWRIDDGQVADAELVVE
jgi:[CysO sulfur-carrier protein]-S-L-cysteine hydrolase